jgi:threonylcarbamoyladenosine tRNA methylthiotransferase MtaB
LKKIAFYTLGCKVNQVETEQLKEEFIRRGYEIVEFRDKADVYLINTCTVTHVSDRKSRAIIRRAVRSHPQALVAVTGCMAQVASKELAGIEGIDLIVSNLDKENIADIIEALDPEQEKPVIIEPLSDKDRKLRPVLYSHQHERTRAFVKIQDGCESGCSYCIVPRARGPVRSKLPEHVLQEIEQLLSLGYREIVLTGIHTGFYGKDLDNWDLLSLFNKILAENKAQYRLRLSSVEPLEVSPELIDLVSSNSRICRHFHIPLQSGSNRILKDMNRRYSREYYYDLLQGIAAQIPGVALTTDVMVGFPGEDDKDFQDSYDLIDSLPFMDLHVFPYSRRPGTRAASMEPQVLPQKKQARSQQLIQLARQKHSNFITSQVGQELTLLVEKQIGEEDYIGLSDNYIEVNFQSPHDLRGELVRVRVEEINDNRATGRLF